MRIIKTEQYKKKEQAEEDLQKVEKTADILTEKGYQTKTHLLSPILVFKEKRGFFQPSIQLYYEKERE